MALAFAAGKTKTCLPSDAICDPSAPQTLAYHAQSTTLSPKCAQPS